MNEDDLLRKGFIKLGDGTWSKRMPNNPGSKAHVQTDKPKTENTLVTTTNRKERVLAKHGQRITIRYTRYGVRPIDPDSIGTCAKDILDFLRKCELIPDDNPLVLKFEPDQVKVKHYADQKNLVEIIYP